MPIVGLLGLVIDAICCVHVVRTGRPYYWIFIIVGVPIIGPGIYFFTQIIPELEHSRAARQMKADVGKLVDPDKAFRQAANNLEMLDTAETRVEMARQCLVREQYDDAVKLLEGSLAGAHENDVAILLMISEAEFMAGNPARCIEFLDRIRTEHPDLRSETAHLLYARSEEALGRTDDALSDYDVLVEYATGEEARCRYALLLQRTGHVEQARAQFGEVVNSVDRASKHYLRAQKDWYQVAKRNL